MSNHEQRTRISVLQLIGSGLIASAVIAGPAAAQPTAKIAPNARLATLNPQALSSLRLGARAPNSAGIANLGLTPEGVAALTPAASELTKADLVALGTGKTTPATAALTVEDIGSIRNAFGKFYAPARAGRGSLAAMDISCCSCTPCCCAAAVSAPASLS